MVDGKNDDGGPGAAEELDFEEIYECAVEQVCTRLEEEIARDMRIGGVTPDHRLIHAKQQREMFDINRRHDDKNVRAIRRWVLESACQRLWQRLH